MAEIDAQYERLLKADVRRHLPIVPRAQFRMYDPRAEAIPLLAHASILAYSESPEDKTRAYEIATRVLYVWPTPPPAVVAASDAILARLGNFPGRQLLRTRHGEHAGTQAFPLALEGLARQLENTIKRADASELALTDFQYDLLTAMNRPGSVSVSAPTSAGKSFVFTIEIARRLKEAPNAIVYVVPTRALMRQVHLKILSELAAAGLQDVPVRSIPIPIPREKAPRGCVYVLTQERLHSLLNSDEGRPWITLVLIDEAQGIGGGSRGIVLQTAVEEVQGQPNRPEVHFASPLISNPKYLLDYFERPGPREPIVEKHSPVSQNLILVRPVKGKSKEAQFQAKVSGKVVDLGTCELKFEWNGGVYERLAKFALAVTKEDDATIVYRNGPGRARKLAKEIADRLPESTHPELHEFAQFLHDHIHPEYTLITVVKHGVGYHSAELPTVVRSQVERLFETNKLRFVCCTSTLLQGVNLPARHILIEDPKMGNDHDMERKDFLNLSGRAGRLVKEFHGNVWCLKPDDWTRGILDGPETVAIKSSLEKVFEDGGKVVTAAAEGKKLPPGERDVAMAALGKVYTEYTLTGRSVDEAPFARNAPREALHKTAEVLRNLEIDVPAEVLRKNSTISPILLNRLYLELKAEAERSAEDLIALHPHLTGSNIRLQKIIQRTQRVLEEETNDRWKLWAALANEWIRDKSYKEIIRESIRVDREREERRIRENDARLRRSEITRTEHKAELEKIQNQHKEVNDIIDETIAHLEKHIRHVCVRNLRAYADVLGAVLHDMGRDDLRDKMSPVHLYLECGASDPIIINLISVGISRTTAILIRRLTNFPENASPEDCIRHLRRTNVDALNLPAACKIELKQLGYSA